MVGSENNAETVAGANAEMIVGLRREVTDCGAHRHSAVAAAYAGRGGKTSVAGRQTVFEPGYSCSPVWINQAIKDCACGKDA